MIKSDSLDKIAPALIAAQREIKNPKETSDNPYFHSSYASLDEWLAVIVPVLNEHGIYLGQFGNGDELETVLIHESGQYIGGSAKLILDKLTSQSKGSATTYERRYSVAAAVGKASEKDDDAEGAMRAHRPRTEERTEIAPAEHPSDVQGFALRIGASESLDELTELGLEIAKSDLTQPKKEILKALYATAKKRLEAKRG